MRLSRASRSRSPPPVMSTRGPACGGSISAGLPTTHGASALRRRRHRPRAGWRLQMERWCRRCGSMPVRMRPAGCCCRSITSPWTGCRGASWCPTSRRHGKRLRRGGNRCCRHAARRSGAGRSALPPMRRMRSGQPSFPSGRRCWRPPRSRRSTARSIRNATSPGRRTTSH